MMHFAHGLFNYVSRYELFGSGPGECSFNAYTRETLAVAVADIKRGRVIDLSHAMSDFDVELLYENLEAQLMEL